MIVTLYYYAYLYKTIFNIYFILMIILLYGSTGWIGSHIKNYLNTHFKNIIVHLGIARCDDFDQLSKEITRIGPDRIICSIGRAYGKNVYNTSYIEDKLNINIRDNIIGPINISNICIKSNIHCTFVGTGCVYRQENKLFNELDKPTLISSNHAIIKSTTEQLIQNNYTNCLHIKLSYPISGDFHPKCLVSKIISYEKIVNSNISISYLPDIIPILLDMTINHITGIFHLTNTGSINLLDTKLQYKIYNDKTLDIKEYSIEEHNTIIGERSNVVIDNKKISTLYPTIMNTNDVVTLTLDNMKNKCQAIIKCICCQNESLNCILDLKYQPLANDFHFKNVTSHNYPLKLMNCTKCNHCQLSHAVNPEILFKNYKYVSGTSKTGHKFFKDNAELIQHFNNNKKGKILDIACNDGTQLDYFKELGWETYGVDPAENLCPIAKEKGHFVICRFWDDKCVEELPIMDVITAQNVFAHTATASDSFLLNCKKIMDENSSLYIQTSQRDMIINGEFDTIYHEHISFFNTKSMKILVERCGLELNRVLENEIHGRSYIFEIKLKKTNEYNVDEIMRFEEKLGLYTPFIYEKFKLNSDKCVKTLSLTIDKYRKTHKCIGFGAAAKGQTVLCYGNIDLDYIIDENTLKTNTFSPKLDIPIVDIDYFINDNSSEKFLIVILAWNFAKEIIGKINKVKGLKNIIIIEKYFPEIVFF